MTRPNFFIVGAPKCGTTAWVEYLSTHRDISFSSAKEPHYFCTDFPSFRWATQEKDYLNYFNQCGGYHIVGEASVQYLYSEEAAKNIAKFCPQAKILIFLREPVSFLRSYHNQLLLNLDEDITDFSEAWALSDKRISINIPSSCREPKFLNYKKVAKFREQIDRYLSVFPASQVKIIWFEDWLKAPQKTYLSILDFLELSDDGRCEFPVIHSAKHMKSNYLAKLTQRPPYWALKASSILKTVLGVKQLNLAARLKKLNERAGYRDHGSSSIVSEEVAEYYSDDYVKLKNKYKQT